MGTITLSLSAMEVDKVPLHVLKKADKEIQEAGNIFGEIGEIVVKSFVTCDRELIKKTLKSVSDLKDILINIRKESWLEYVQEKVPKIDFPAEHIYCDLLFNEFIDELEHQATLTDDTVAAQVFKIIEQKIRNSDSMRIASKRSVLETGIVDMLDYSQQGLLNKVYTHKILLHVFDKYSSYIEKMIMLDRQREAQKNFILFCYHFSYAQWLINDDENDLALKYATLAHEKTEEWGIENAMPHSIKLWQNFLSGKPLERRPSYRAQGSKKQKVKRKCGTIIKKQKMTVEE